MSVPHKGEMCNCESLNYKTSTIFSSLVCVCNKCGGVKAKLHKRCEIQNTVIAVIIMALGFYIITVDSENESCSVVFKVQVAVCTYIV